MNNVLGDNNKKAENANIPKLDPLWVKVATKFVKEAELKIINNPPIPKQKEEVEIRPNGFII